jgi:hypothetical protein
LDDRDKKATAEIAEPAEQIHLGALGVLCGCFERRGD